MHRTGLVEFEAVLAVARRRSFRAAAVELDMSTSALSNAVAGLEARLGVRLFHRTTRSVSLTEAGHEFLAQVGPAVAQIQSAMTAVNDHRSTPSGTIRINSSLGGARMIFRPLVLEFLRRYPAITVDLVTEGRMVDIVAEGFDVGIRPNELVPRDMIRVPIGSNLRMAVVGSADYFARNSPPRSPVDLSAHQCVRSRLPSGAPSPWEFIAQGELQTVEVPGNLILDAPILMQEAALRGLGLAQIAEWYIHEDVASGRLVRVLDDWMTPFPGLCLYYSGRRHIPAALRAFIDLIHEVNGATNGHRIGIARRSRSRSSRRRSPRARRARSACGRVARGS
ncbi:MAG TPA: LysR family transcriptional regulator [Polyangiaceae bacterium]|nr:LysR family transcriptional regulator [Polyangiaceae bacterium]